MRTKELSEYPSRDITPEHTLREEKHPDGLHADVVAAFKYIDNVIDTSDYVEPIAWHGWAIREAFLAGITYAENKQA